MQHGAGQVPDIVQPESQNLQFEPARGAYDSTQRKDKGCGINGLACRLHDWR